MTQRNARKRDEIKRAELKQETAADDLRWVLSDPRGRRFMWALLGECGLYANTFNTNFGVSSFNAGRQSVAQSLLLRITGDAPDLYLDMQAEAIERDRLEAMRASNDEETDE